MIAVTPFTTMIGPRPLANAALKAALFPQNKPRSLGMWHRLQLVTMAATMVISAALNGAFSEPPQQLSTVTRRSTNHNPRARGIMPAPMLLPVSHTPRLHSCSGELSRRLMGFIAVLSSSVPITQALTFAQLRSFTSERRAFHRSLATIT